ncbi:MAG TPA: heparinase II/III family protein, partial [Caulobacteraceae bacterium]
VTLDEASPGAVLAGLSAWSLGPRLTGADWRVTPRRSEGDGVVLLEISHDAWLGRLGVRAERRLYVDAAAEELRGEDRFMPTKALKGDRRRFVPYAIRFPLHPDARASIAMDGKAVLIRHGHDPGWWLRTDAAEIALVSAVRWTDGEARATEQIVLSGLFRLEAGGRVRWKLGRT